MGRAPPRPSPGVQCAPGPAPSATAANGRRRRGALSGAAGGGCSWRAGAARPGAEWGREVSECVSECGAGRGRRAFPSQPALPPCVRELRAAEEFASVGSAGPTAREATGPPFWVGSGSVTARSGRSGARWRQLQPRRAGGGRRFQPRRVPRPLPRDRRAQRSAPGPRPKGRRAARSRPHPRLRGSLGVTRTRSALPSLFYSRRGGRCGARP